MSVYFSLGLGSDYASTANTWASNGYVATGTTNLVATNGATFYITGVQLEEGTAASPFENRLYTTELALCQRYCFNVSSPSGVPIGLFGANSSSSGLATIPFPVTPRVAPTGLVSVTSNWIMNNFGSGATAVGAVTFTNATPINLVVSLGGGSGMNAGYSGQFYANASAGQFYTTGSEL
jgi:hypothetical protein